MCFILVTKFLAASPGLGIETYIFEDYYCRNLPLSAQTAVPYVNYVCFVVGYLLIAIVNRCKSWFH